MLRRYDIAGQNRQDTDCAPKHELSNQRSTSGDCTGAKRNHVRHRV
jgi:hypothetical protein